MPLLAFLQVPTCWCVYAVTLAHSRRRDIARTYRTRDAHLAVFAILGHFVCSHERPIRVLREGQHLGTVRSLRKDPGGESRMFYKCQRLIDRLARTPRRGLGGGAPFHVWRQIDR